MVQLASRVGVSEIAVKSNVSAVKSALSTLERLLPVPLASKDMLVKAPSAEMSQSEVSMTPGSPLSPMLNKPVTYRALEAVRDREIERLPANELEVAAPVWVKTPDMEAAPPTSNDVLVVLPALIPNLVLPVSSKLVETETPALKVDKSETTNPPAESMVTSPVVVPIVEPSIVRVSMVKTPVSEIVKTVVPASWIVKSPEPCKLMLKFPVPSEAEANDDISRPASAEILEFTSRYPETRRSDMAERPRLVVSVPNLE